MSGWLVALTGLVYLAVAIHQATKGNLAMFIIFSGYAFSNVGFLLALK
jgi:hypothetical protein